VDLRFPRTILIFVLLTCLPREAAAQSFRFDAWTSDNGLPQNSVYSILQTRDGYIWFTTLDGLVRYDGASFKVFNKANTSGFLSNRCTRLFQDSKGDLWICTEDGGIMRYHDGAFSTYTTDDGLLHNWTYGFRETEEGDLIVSTHHGLSRWNGKRFDTQSARPGHFDAVLGYRGRSSAVWYRLYTELRRLKDGILTAYSVHEAILDPVYDPQLFEDREGRLWIGSKHEGLMVLQNGAFTSYTIRDGLPRSAITAFCQDREGAIWFGTENAGIVRFKNGRFTTYDKKDGLSSNGTVTIYEDSEGTIWVGTTDGGINRITRKVVRVYSTEARLKGRAVYPVFEDSSGNVWAGSSALNRLKEDVFTQVDLNRAGYNAPRPQVTALCEDRDGRLWIGTDGALLSLKDGKLNRETEKLGLKPGAVLIKVIFQDRNGYLWVGTEGEVIKYGNGERAIYKVENGLAGISVNCILEDMQGDFWIGTYGGLSRFKNGAFTSYTEREGLSSNRVRSLYEDDEGTLWIGTYDGGLNRFKGGRFTRYTTSQGLFNNGVFQILEDDRGNFWMSCNAGIYRVSRQQLNDFAEGKISTVDCISYGKADGMLNVECNGGRQPAGIKSRDGRLWFPTLDGVAVIDPREIAINQRPPPVVIENVLIDNREVPIDQWIDVKPGLQNLEIHYAGLSFIKPDRVGFKYKLEGLDGDWISVGSRRTAYYSHLPPGEYTFRVIAANSDGVWNMEGVTLRVNVLPPFWRTWWFMLIVMATVTGGAVLLYVARVLKLKRAHIAQQEFSRRLIDSQENDRKRIGAELHDGLGQSLIVIKNLVLLILSHPKNQASVGKLIDEISSEASRAIGEVREISYNLRPFQLDRLGLTRAIESIIDKVSKSCNIRFFSDLDRIDNIFTKEEEINLYRIVQESLNNMVKHSGATRGSVVIRRMERDVELTVKDNGKGFDQDGGRPSDSRQSGFGLVGISERVRMLGGVYEIQSEQGKGTTIQIRIGLNGKKDERNKNPYS
jgi:signal transduction histidine kinase/ligand-binding sensor domain-containing protein